MSSNIVAEKSLEFAVRIVKLYQHLKDNNSEYVMSKQLLKSGTSIGANVREAVYGYSKKDFSAKMGIALKEASETAYWIELLHRTEYLNSVQYKSISADCQELIKLLTSIVKNSKHSTNDSC